MGLGLIFWFSGGNKNDTSKSGTKNSQPTSHITGQGKKKVTLMEYGDYQCPVCGAYYPTVKQITEKYKNEIFFQFRNLPLTQVHPNAFAAARAAEAAGLQGKYFEMHSLLYENQQSWSQTSDPTTFFKAFAQQIGLDINKYNSDYSSAVVNDAIQADITAFGKTGQQQATPTFFINNVYVSNEKLADSNGPSLDKFSQQLDAAIATSNK